MKVTPLNLRSFMYAAMLLMTTEKLCCHVEKADGLVLHVVPNQLQHFEYDSIIFHCAGFAHFTRWRVLRKSRGKETLCGTNWATTNGPCFIKHAFELDSGEYWCDTYGDVRSSSINISVTAGPVSLVIPALPVIEGELVSLGCMTRKGPSSVAEFYKDGILKGGAKTIHDVSKSDEGFYKCDIPGVGESAESWLAVRASPVLNDELSPSHHRPFYLLMLPTCSLAFLLVVMGLSLCWKHNALCCISCKAKPGETEGAVTSEDDPERTSRHNSSSTTYLMHKHPSAVNVETREEDSERRASRSNNSTHKNPTAEEENFSGTLTEDTDRCQIHGPTYYTID